MKDYLEKRREELRKQGGFTLMEMLIVVAIIAVLIAIAIPVFTTQLETSREATDIANVRSAYAEVMTEYMTDPKNTHSMTVSAQQQQDGWQGGNSGLLTIQQNGSESQFSYNAKTTGNSYTITVTNSGSVSVN